MKVVKYWGDMVMFLHMADQSGSRILNRLDLLDGVIGQASKDTIAVIQSGGYYRVDNSLHGRGGKELSDAADSVYLVMDTNRVYMGLESEVII